MVMEQAPPLAASTIAIIGGGQAGGEAATLLRQNRFEGRIVLVGEEDYLPYMRPPSSPSAMRSIFGTTFKSSSGW